MFEELTREIKVQLYERAKGPLFTTFLISWLVFNIRTVAIFFSDISIYEKFELWNSIYPTHHEWLIHSLGLPFLAAGLIILIYPIPARLAYHYWHWQHLKVKKIQQKLEDETPITQEEAKVIRQTSLEEQTKLQERLRLATNINTEQSNQIALLREQLITLNNSHTQLKQEIKTVEQEQTQAKTSTIIKSSSSKKTLKGKKNDVLDNLSSQLPKLIVDALQERGLIGVLLEVYLFMYANQSAVMFDDMLDYINTYTDYKSVELQYALDELISMGLISKTQDYFELNAAGRKYAVISGLTKVELFI